MKLIPIFAREGEPIEDRIWLFNALGCEMYRDGNGQLYAVAHILSGWLGSQYSLIYEADQVPPQWVLVTAEVAPAR